MTNIDQLSWKIRLITYDWKYIELFKLFENDSFGHGWE